MTYEFKLRPGLKFHNGDPITAEDVKFSYDRYRGAGAKELQTRVRQVDVVDPLTVRFQLREPWPDFMTFYGTTATAAGTVVWACAVALRQVIPTISSANAAAARQGRAIVTPGRVRVCSQSVSMHPSLSPGPEVAASQARPRPTSPKAVTACTAARSARASASCRASTLRTAMQS